MMSSWPVYTEERAYPEEERVVSRMKDIVRGIRNIRAEMNVENNRKTNVYVVSADEGLRGGFAALTDSVKPLMNASQIIIEAQKPDIGEDAVSVVVPDASVYLPLQDLVDFEQERERLSKEEERLKKEIKRAEGMLKNEKFVSKAPAAKVEEERAKLEKYTQMLAQVQERMAGLKK